MKFSVVLKNSEGKSIISKRDKGLGLEALDMARKTTGVPELDADRVSGFVSGRGKLTHSFVVSEQAARKSGMFNEDNVINVAVRGNINSAVELAPIIDRDEVTGEVKDVAWAWAIADDAHFAQAWEDAGFPSEWDWTE